MQKRITEHKKIFIYLLVWCFTQKKNRNISKISLTLANATDDTTNWTNIVSQESVISEETDETNTGFDTNYLADYSTGPVERKKSFQFDTCYNLLLQICIYPRNKFQIENHF